MASTSRAFFVSRDYFKEDAMAKWRKRESLGRALAREGGSIAKGVGKELFSIATLGLFSPKRYPNKPRSGRRR
jgi:hypothetical protein